MMKKLLIGASALAFATVAQAQNVPQNIQAQANSVASYNTLDVDQNAVNFTNLDANRPSVDQNNNGQTAFNEGASEVVPTDKSRASLLKMADVNTMTQAVDGTVPEKMAQSGNKASVDQGTNADPVEKAENNKANINQQGGNQGWAAIQQDNDNNDARIVQTERANTDEGSKTVNRAYIQQNGYFQGNSAGSAGEANSRNRAVVRQHYTGGGDNIAVILQGNARPDNGGLRDGAVNSDATIEQNGGDNWALISQARSANTNRGDDNIAHIDQLGLSNRASIQQENSADAAIYQDNTGNEALIRQTGLVGFNQEADIYQTAGSYNFGAINQEGSDQTASIYQQNGDNNQAFVEQRLSASGATAAVHQNGATNYADILQSVSDVSANVLQKGTANVALIQQTSAGNSGAYVSTVGSGNSVTITQ